MSRTQLCEYCLAINFNDLSHPTVGQIRSLEEPAPDHADPAKKRRPPRSAAKDEGPWSLGLQSRIEESSSSCCLCHAICELVHQQPRVRRHWASYSWTDPVCIATIATVGQCRPRNDASWHEVKRLDVERVTLHWQQLHANELVHPGPIPRELRWPKGAAPVYLTEAFQLCSPGAPEVLQNGLFEDYHPSPDDMIFGGRIRPAMVDMRLPARWLKECLAKHGASCDRDGVGGPGKERENSETPLSMFRLVDVVSKMVVEFSNVKLPELKYVALTYVWGSKQRVTLNTDSLPSMKEPGSLGSTTLPQTIQDAMAVTANLGFQYIWIDSLCIVQDNEDDKAMQIGYMSMIYPQAELTIAAAAGASAEAPLPGVTNARTATQVEVPLASTDGAPTRSLLSTLSGRHEVALTPYQETVWGSRGWTFQEHVLSKRVLIFMEHQMLWECGTCSWNEESHLETDVARVSWLSNSDIQRLDPWEKDFDMWRAIVVLIRNYQLRRLTFPGDALDAVDAILSHVEKLSGQEFVWGMPVSVFDSSISLWPVEYAAPERRTGLTSRRVTALKKRVPFPSWSWVGWEKLYAPTIDSDMDSFNYANAYFILRNLPLRLDPLGKHEFPSLPLSLDDVLSSSASLSRRKPEDVPDNQYVCFRAQVLRFSDAKTVRLDDVKHVPPGTAFFSTEHAPFMISQVIPFHNTTRGGDDDPPNLFLPLPERWNRVIVDKVTHRRVGECGTCKLVGPEDAMRAPTLVHLSCKSKNAMALEVVEEHEIYYRVNVAKIERAAWLNATFCSEIVVLG